MFYVTTKILVQIASAIIANRSQLSTNQTLSCSAVPPLTINI